MYHNYVIAALAHSGLIIGQWLSPSLATALTEIAGFEIRGEWRFAGLTWSFNATNIANSLAVSLLILSNLRLFPRWLSVAAFLVILIAMTGLGRTSLFVYCAALVAVLATSRDTAKYMILGVCTALIISLNLDELAAFFWGNVRVLMLISTLKALDGGGGQSYFSELIDTWSGFFFLPEGVFHLLFGTGLSGRGTTYIASDVGHILMVWGIGLVGLGFVLYLHFHLLKHSLRLNESYPIKLRECVVLFLFMVVVVSFKEQELFVRHIVTGMAMLAWIVDQRTSSIEEREFQEKLKCRDIA